MIIDRSVYPDAEPPATLQSLADRADYMQRICAAFDFGVFPEETDWVTFAGCLRSLPAPGFTRLPRFSPLVWLGARAGRAEAGHPRVESRRPPRGPTGSVRGDGVKGSP
jgi:hypothetical protein